MSDSALNSDSAPGLLFFSPIDLFLFSSYFHHVRVFLPFFVAVVQPRHDDEWRPWISKRARLLFPVITWLPQYGDHLRENLYGDFMVPLFWFLHSQFSQVFIPISLVRLV
jgi:hypothetical protein